VHCGIVTQQYTSINTAIGLIIIEIVLNHLTISQ